LEAPVRSLLIASADRKEGRTFVATNLAVSLAQSGRHVILVDADLRHPQIAQIFGLRPKPGLTDWIAEGEASAAAFLQSANVANLQILSSGTMPANPAELLGSARAGEVMHQLEQLADIVLYDSPPTVVVTDAQLLATRVNAAIQVVRANRTPVNLVRRGKELLQGTKVRLLGPILNGTGRTALGYYAYQYRHPSYLRGGQQMAPGKSQGLRRNIQQTRVQPTGGPTSGETALSNGPSAALTQVQKPKTEPQIGGNDLEHK
jgi:capsular exopolysaccharide synthesis family protein